MPPLLTERFERALTWAAQLHRAQVRKATLVPYVSHLLAVCSIVLEHGGDEDQAITALLHDAIEDQDVWDHEIAARFGPRVAALVRACSEDEDWSMAPWRVRKDEYLAQLASDALPDGALLVAAADKLHNARATLADLRRRGESAWSRFSGGREGQLWFYGAAAAIVSGRFPGPLADELAETVADLAAFPAGEVGLLEGIATTRAIRRIRPDPVPEADLARILWAATRAPSGSNRQPARFLVLRDGPVAVQAKGILGAVFRRAWAEKRADDGYDTGSGASDESRKARMARTMQHFVDHFEQIPVVVLACLVRHRAPHASEGASVYPACQNLLLAARALGYGGVLTMWHEFAGPDLRARLAIPDDVAIAATIPLGRPEVGHGPVRRRPVADVVFDGRWGDAARWAVDPPGALFTSGGPPSRSADDAAGTTVAPRPGAGPATSGPERPSGR